MTDVTVARPGAAPAPVPSIGARLDRLPIGPTHRTVTLVVGLGLFFDFFDSNLSGTISKVLQAEFAVSGTSLKLVLASAFVGQFVGAVWLGRLADRVGRRRAFLINLGIYSFFTLLGAFSPNAAWLIVTRFLAGIGIGAELALSDSYLSELLPARKRGRFIAWAYTIAFCGVPAVGVAALWFAPRMVLGIDGWRWLFVLGALGAVVVWVLRRRLIESPRWLAANGRVAEAEALVSRMEAEAGLTGRPAQSGSAGWPGEPGPAGPVGAARPVGSPRLGLGLLFRPPYRRRTVMLWILSILSVTAYYGFGTLAPQVLAAKGYGIVQGLAYTAVAFVGYPLGSLLSVPLMDRVERKVLLAGSAAAMAACGIGFGLAGSGLAVATFGIGYTLLSNVFANASHVYLAEQYPTEVRASAAGARTSVGYCSAR
ncbi:MAG TPA: MFS transporter [Pilimelia sp.]|nr:MFS transporter [Pilimelia sp.]